MGIFKHSPTLTLVSLSCLTVGFSAHAEPAMTEAGARRAIISTAQCPESVRDLVDHIVNSAHPNVTRMVEIAKLRNRIENQQELLACTSQLDQATEYVLQKNSDSVAAGTVGAKVRENIKGALRVLTTVISSPESHCGRSGCAIGSLGVRG